MCAARSAAASDIGARDTPRVRCARRGACGVWGGERAPRRSQSAPTRASSIHPKPDAVAPTSDIAWCAGRVEEKDAIAMTASISPASSSPATASATSLAMSASAPLARSLPEVRVLGEVEITRRSELSVTATDLLCYFSLHPDAALDADDLVRLLERSGLQRAKTIRNALCELRQAYVVENVGTRRHPRYCVRDVESDWGQFQALTGRAGRSKQALAEDGLAALELVRAKPFLSRGGGICAWAFPRLVEDITTDVVAVAKRTANLLAARGRMDDAGWALRQGRLVAPKDPALRETHLTLAERAGGDVLGAALDLERRSAGDRALRHWLAP